MEQSSALLLFGFLRPAGRFAFLAVERSPVLPV